MHSIFLILKEISIFWKEIFSYLLTTHTVLYVLKCIRNILKQKIRRSSGLSQAGNLKEESASGIFKSLSSASI